MIKELGKPDKQKSFKEIEYKAENDPYMYRISIATLSGVSLIGVLTIAVATVLGNEVPQAMTAVTSASIGALVTRVSSKR